MDLKILIGESSYLSSSSDTNNPNKTPEDYIKDILEKDLPRSERQTLTTELKWNYILDKHMVGEKKSKVVKRKKLFLTRSQRKNLNLLKLPKDGWNYNDLQSMRNMWMEYMRKNLSVIKKTPSCEEPSWCNLSSILTKSEFIGAEITVIRSTVPSTVGITGTVVLETRSTFQIVTPNSELKNLLKKPSVFTFTLDGRKFTIFGKHLNMKPNERSVKKIKALMLPDI